MSHQTSSPATQFRDVGPATFTSSRASRSRRSARTVGSSASITKEAHWEKLETLQQLHENGFMTDAEYMERKAQLIDELTGTSVTRGSSRRRSRRAQSHKASGLPTIVPVGPPSFENVEPEAAIKHEFDSTTRTWAQRRVWVKLWPQPFGRGGLRVVYHLQDLGPDRSRRMSEDSDLSFMSPQSAELRASLLKDTMASGGSSGGGGEAVAERGGNPHRLLASVAAGSGSAPPPPPSPSSMSSSSGLRRRRVGSGGRGGVGGHPLSPSSTAASSASGQQQQQMAGQRGGEQKYEPPSPTLAHSSEAGGGGNGMKGTVAVPPSASPTSSLPSTPLSTTSSSVPWRAMSGRHSLQGVPLVAKVAIDPMEDSHTYYRDVEMQAHCLDFAKRFNQYDVPRRVRFVKAWVVELLERCVEEERAGLSARGRTHGRKALCGVERFIDGPYKKHNNNFGYVNDAERNTPQAFSHFTYEASGQQMLVVDIQGVDDIYTDPQIHTVAGHEFGKGNMGMEGIQRFLQSHQCNAICRYLKLPPCNPKTGFDASGTVPAQRLMAATRVEVVAFAPYPSSAAAAVPPPPVTGSSRHSVRMNNSASPLLSRGRVAEREPPASPDCCCTVL